MKKVIIASVVIAMVVGLSLTFGDPDKRGNDLPKGKSFNFNVIGVPNQKNWEEDSYDTGGEGKRIFVLRTGTTQFYVHGADQPPEILDRDGTDGSVGWGLNDPGIILPYVGTGASGGEPGTGVWKCEIYVRLCGPIDSSVHFKSYVYDGLTYIYLGDMEFTETKGAKFNCRTSKLLADGYKDILWEMDQKNKFRIMQFRIFVIEE